MKKGSETLMFVFATISLVIVLFFAWFIFIGFGDTSKVEQELIAKKQVSNDLLLLNFIRTPVEIDGNKGNVADLIVNSYYKNDYQDLEELSKNILDPLYPENKCYDWNLEFRLMPDDKKLKSVTNKVRIGSSPIADSSLEIPLLEDPNKKIKVRLYEEC